MSSTEAADVLSSVVDHKAIPAEFEPILQSDLSDENLKTTFDRLLVQAMTCCHHCGWRDRQPDFSRRREDFHDLLVQEVSAHPILARVIEPRDKQSILGVVSNVSIAYHHHTCLLPTLQFLIQMNPWALFWRNEFHGYSTRVLSNAFSSDLLIWLARHHSWVFHHEYCGDWDPTNAVSNEAGEFEISSCPLREFLAIYPRWFRSKRLLPGIVYRVANGYFDIDLFEWVLAHTHSATVDTHGDGSMSILHCAANSGPSPNSKAERVCRLIMRKFPHLAQQQIDEHCRILPIHLLLEYTDGNRFAQNMVILLLQAYPESYDQTCFEKPPLKYPSPSLTPFCQEIKPLLDKKRKLELVKVLSGLKETSVEEKIYAGRTAMLTEILLPWIADFAKLPSSEQIDTDISKVHDKYCRAR